MKVLTFALVFSAFLSQTLFAQNDTEKQIEKSINIASLKISKTLTDAGKAVANQTNKEIKKELDEFLQNQKEEDTVEKDNTDEGMTLYSDTTDNELAEDTIAYKNSSWSGSIGNIDINKQDVTDIILAIIVLICVILIPTLCIFGLPLLIIWLIARNRRKMERERNELIKALAESGKDVSKLVDEQIQENKISKPRNEDIYNKGIKNICLGVGLGIMIYFITHTMAIVSIGILIVCIGIGQIITSKHSASQSPTTIDSTEENKPDEEN